MQGYHVPHVIRVSNLKKVRIANGLLQKELAARSGVSIKVIGNYEQLRRDINHARVDIVYRLAAAIGCSIEDLLEKDRL